MREQLESLLNEEENLRVAEQNELRHIEQEIAAAQERIACHEIVSFPFSQMTVGKSPSIACAFPEMPTNANMPVPREHSMKVKTGERDYGKTCRPIEAIIAEESTICLRHQLWTKKQEDVKLVSTII